MRFMMLMIPKVYNKASASSAPDPKAIERMTKYNDTLPAGGGPAGARWTTPPVTGARPRSPGANPKVTDGPFAEAKEVLGGYWIDPGFKSKARGRRMGDRVPADEGDIDRGPAGLRDGGLPAGGAEGVKKVAANPPLA